MLDRPFSKDRFSEIFDVSRETMDQLGHYVGLIEKWNRSINLVSKSTIDDIWHRHIADSAQLFKLSDAQNEEVWLDIGSGGGLPGIVISILSNESQVLRKIVLVESDSRKCAFLRTVVRDLGLSIEIIEDRIENVLPIGADIISARAFTRLNELLCYTQQHGTEHVRCLFLKGKSHLTELTEAKESWNISVESIPSLTDSSARVLKIKEISRAI